MSDLISRQAAIDALGGNEPVGDPSKMDDDDVVKMWERIRIINIINKLPSAQQDCTDCAEYDHDTHSCPKFCDVIRKTVEETKQERTGRWIIKDNPGTGWYRITCSECGEDVTSTAPCIGFYPNAKVMWNYCPNCGARRIHED